MEVREVTVEEALNRNFEEFHIPGALNVPLFTKEEREKISEVYYSHGEKEARLFALKLVAPKLYDVVSRVRKIKGRGSSYT